MEIERRRINGLSLHFPVGALLVLMSLSSCTVVNPVPSQEDDSFFRKTADSTKTESGKSAQDCCCKASYADHLGEEIEAADKRRRDWLEKGTERLRTSTAYNALLVPLSVFVAARSIADPSASLVRDASAIALGTYGLLSSGVPERDKLYLEAARQASCAISLSAVDLYEKERIERVSRTRACDTGLVCSGVGGDEQSTRSCCKAGEASTDNAEVSLENRIACLEGSIKEFTQTRDDLLSKMPVGSSGSDTSISLSIGARLREVGVLPGSAGSGNRRQNFLDRSQAKIDDAGAKLLQLRSLRSEIRYSGQRLRNRIGYINQRLIVALNDRTPTLTAPSQLGAVRNELANLVNALEKKNAENGATGQSKRGERKGYAQEHVSALSSDKGLLSKSRALDSALVSAQDWLSAHETRKREILAEVSRGGCSEELFGELSPLTIRSTEVRK
ncbi:hypothetical protein [Dechloromonas sp. CZR5]|uniref:hypothetical protein n=1 Tax=Dechloromonas sp. CZR5 TaxID=2608630 RepID=UPI00123C9D26|nr:hypothetical protein [Dechloromonas sp. CZR5]